MPRRVCELCRRGAIEYRVYPTDGRSPKREVCKQCAIAALVENRVFNLRRIIAPSRGINAHLNSRY
jgi:hypothetical protein